MKVTITWTLILATAYVTNLQIPSASAANVRLFVNGQLKSIVIEGIIEPGDSKKFTELAKRAQAEIYGVSTFSPGGDFEEAMKIGRTMRALELASRVPMRNELGRPICEKNGVFTEPTPKDPKFCTCASACFFIHIGGISRSGNFIAVHRPYFVKGKFGKLSEAAAKRKFDVLQKTAKSYMKEMEVPEHVQADVLGTSSDRGLMLDEKTIKTYFWFDTPLRYEWLRNKCHELTSDEEAKFSQYRARLDTARYDWDRAGFTALQKDEYGMFLKKEELSRNCSVEEVKASRAAAYKRFFGVQPTDLSNHDFSVWANSVKYLRKPFDDIKQEGETTEEPFRYGMTTLSFPEREDGFKLSFHDHESEPRVVKTVDLFKGNTSKNFQQKIVEVLEKSWGKATSVKVVDGAKEYTWDKETEGFWAKLKQYLNSADGPFTTLEIGAFFSFKK